MADDPRAIAHGMLTQALTGQPITLPALVGSELALAAVWLRTRAASVLAAALRPGELLQKAATAVSTESPDDDPLHPAPARWQHAAAVNIAAAEVIGAGKQVDPSTVRLLTLDPDGMLAALAELTAALYRIHDGVGAGAVVRALRP